MKAEHDVALCLSPVNEEEEGAVDEGYEVFIGCWEGDESGIRKRGTGEDVLKVHTPGILEGGEDFLAFWIKIRRGVIKVGKSKSRFAFMTYSDPSLRHCSWYGYSTGWGAEGDWIFLDEEDTSSSSSSAFSSSDSEAEEVDALEVRPIQYKRPARWVPSTGGYFPHRPVSGGEGPDGEVYVGMARHEDAYLVGMVVPEHSCCYVPFAGDAIPKKEYFVLSNPASINLTWSPGSMGKVPSGALQGGMSEEGEMLYIGRVSVDGQVSVGKIHPSHAVCYVPYGGAEHAHKNYEVLCVDAVNVKM